MVVVLPTPPFWLAMQKILAIVRPFQRDMASLTPKPIRKTPASFSSVIEMRGLARMRSARKCVSSVAVRP